MKTLFINAKIRLADGKYASSLGADSETGLIIYTGNESIPSLHKKKFDEIIDLQGRHVLPSFSDGHCHLIKGSMVDSELNLRNASSYSDFEFEIKSYRKNLQQNEWITGGYFTDTKFDSGFSAGADILDKICDDVPVFISRLDLHSGFANSKAIELSGILSSEDKFKKGEIIRNNKGKPTGEFKENAYDFINGKIPQKSLTEIAKVVKEKIKKLHSYGITSVSDITLPGDLKIYEILALRNELNLRIDFRLPFESFKDIKIIKERFEPYNNIRFNSFKAFYDGSLSSETALFFNNYKDSYNKGIKTEFVESGGFHEYAFEIDKAGYQMSVHAIGDRAVSELLDLVCRLNHANGKRDRRFRIEHSQHIADKDIKRFQELGVIASVQPAHLFFDAVIAMNKLEFPETTHNYRKLIDSGVIVCFGTDFPVVNENPFENIYYALNRKVDGLNGLFFPEMKINLSECLKAYTYNNAYASFSEDVYGNIECGKSADFIVLEDDIFAMDSMSVKNAKVLMTYFKGKRVY